jgi:hypothetical protein
METDDRRGLSRQGAKAQSSESFIMEKLYVNEIGRDGVVSTVGLFYSRAEAENIIAQLSSNPDRSGCRYEIIDAVRQILSEKGSQRLQSAPRE